MKYKVVQQYVMQDEWFVEAEDKETAIEVAMTSDPEIEHRIRENWTEVEEIKDENRSKN